jgi:hypothetical protein
MIVDDSERRFKGGFANILVEDIKGQETSMGDLVHVRMGEGFF